MYKANLTKELTQLAHIYGKAHFGLNYINQKAITNNAVIFNSTSYNFHSKSWEIIKNNSSYLKRTLKTHNYKGFIGIVPKIMEMQSSNSSDALAMNIFCYPDFMKWNGVKKLFGITDFSDIQFGFKAKVKKLYSENEEDATEIDIRINDDILIECKLTEDEFTKKDKKEVLKYVMFEKIFHKDKLIQDDNRYSNYQLIRNILAAEQHDSRFILICDIRRPDLAKSFYQTIRCIKDDYIDLRTKCEIIYWQDIAQVVGKELKYFLNEKYRI